MGKASAPAAPDYTAIAAADQNSANKQFQMGQDQLAWAKDQYNQVWPYAQQYMTSQASTMQAESDAAKKQQEVYSGTELPAMQNFMSTADQWSSPQRQQQQAGSAMADVSAAFDQNRSAALQGLESYGIDPSQTRYQALDLGTRISQAAATAAAGTQAATNTQATGLALQGEGINMLAGFPGQIASSYSTATGAGQAGVLGLNQTVNTGANAMGNPNSYFNGSTNAMNGATSALNTGFSNQMEGAKFNAQQSAGFASGIGSLIGGGIGMAMSPSMSMFGAKLW